MSQTLKLKLKGTRKLKELPQVRKVKVITDDSIISATPGDFFRIGRAKKYIFIYDSDDKTLELPAIELQDIK